MMTKKLQFLLAVFLLVLAIPTLALAAPEKVEDRVKALEDEIRILKNQEDQYQYLKEDTKEFRSHVESEMGKFRESIIEERRGFLNWINFVFVALAMVGSVFAFFMGSKWKNDVKKHFDNKKEEIDQTVAQKEAELKQLLKERIDQLDEKIHELNKMVDERISLREARVLVTGDEPLIKDKDFILKELENRGIKQLHQITYDSEVVKQRINNNEVDIILFFCENENWINELEEMESILIDYKGPTIPLVTYTNGNNKLSRKYEDKYDWYHMANFAPTVISSLISLASVYNRTNRS